MLHYSLRNGTDRPTYSRILKNRKYRKDGLVYSSVNKGSEQLSQFFPHRLAVYEVFLPKHSA
ncbi:hypothetical protein OAL09_03855 [Verrucomicrobia bacterium]|nr:hypothetical protein [Verrucomicrobiota bacterium]NCG28815.1 hypothetical protein [Verrucomicrobiales bacterium]